MTTVDVIKEAIKDVISNKIDEKFSLYDSTLNNLMESVIKINENVKLIKEALMKTPQENQMDNVLNNVKDLNKDLDLISFGDGEYRVEDFMDKDGYKPNITEDSFTKDKKIVEDPKITLSLQLDTVEVSENKKTFDYKAFEKSVKSIKLEDENIELKDEDNKEKIKMYDDAFFYHMIPEKDKISRVKKRVQYYHNVKDRKNIIEIVFCDSKEILKISISKDQLNSIETKERENFYAIIFNGGSFNILSGPQIPNFFMKFHNKSRGMTLHSKLTSPYIG
uniref:Viral A-type inclusion protein n=1 Tax=Parastrongyloides trichosuri TaxID=131310 RepID=A0A0N4ZKR7_PARTI